MSPLIILISSAFVIAIIVIILLALILRKLSFSGVRSKVESQIKILEKKIEDGRPDDKSDLIESIELLKNSIENIRISDSTQKKYPELEGVSNPFQEVDSYIVKLGSGLGRIYVVENRLTKQWFLISKDFSIVEWQK